MAGGYTGMTMTAPADNTDEFLPTRRSLLSRLRDWNDAAGWREFLDAYGRFIFSVARRSGLRPEEAEDVVQETLLSVAKKMPGFRYDERGSFKAWLMLVVRSRIADFLRKKQRRIPEGDGALPEESADHSADAVWEDEWRKRLLESAMERVKRRVPSRQFQVFEMCVVQELSAAQVAEFLRMNSARVYLTKHRVSRQVAAEVKRLADAEFASRPLKTEL